MTRWSPYARYKRELSPVPRAASLPIPKDLLLPAVFNLDRYASQNESLLFKLPREVREIVFDYALREYEDISRPYPSHDFLRRPGQFYPWKSHAALLRTCQRIYNETWWIPITTATHVAVCSQLDYVARDQVELDSWVPLMERSLAIYHRRHCDNPGDRIELEHVNILVNTSMFQLLQPVFGLENFYPQKLTLTVRKYDWHCANHLNWNSSVNGDPHLQQEHLFFPLCSLMNYALPSSLRSLRLELEVVDRLKEMVHELAKQIQANGSFQRSDGVRFLPVAGSLASKTWTGSSIDKNWRRFRDESRPGQIDHEVVFIDFVPSEAAAVPEEDVKAGKKRALDETVEAEQEPKKVRLFLPGTPSRNGSIALRTLKRYTVPGDATVEQALQLTGGFFQNGRFMPRRYRHVPLQ